MTIPVPNRPAYQPGAGPPPPDSEEQKLLIELARATAEVRSDEARAGMRRNGRVGCVMSAGMLGLLAAGCGALMALVMCSGGFTQAMLQMGDKVTADLRYASEQHHVTESNAPALEAFDALRRRDAMTFTAFTVFYQRWADARVDNTLSAEELEQMMVVVRDINAHHGDIDPAVYPELR